MNATFKNMGYKTIHIFWLNCTKCKSGYSVVNDECPGKRVPINLEFSNFVECFYIYILNMSVHVCAYVGRVWIKFADFMDSVT